MVGLKKPKSNSNSDKKDNLIQMTIQKNSQVHPTSSTINEISRKEIQKSFIKVRSVSQYNRRKVINDLHATTERRQITFVEDNNNESDLTA